MLSRALGSRAVRLAATQHGAHVRQQPQRASYSVWDRVQPSLWHPMATLEQSLMELDRVTTQMFSSPFRFSHMVMPRMHADDDEFFRDLTDSGEKESKHKEKSKTHEGQSSDQSFSSYAYSSSTVFDEHGRRITTMRRRYEDSTGRLKAVHEREIDGKKLKSVWKRKQKSDQGVHKTICSSTGPEEFEEEWKKTPFGQAQGHHEAKAKGLEETEKVAEHTTPGPDYEAAEAAPHKECGKEAEGVTKEAHDRTRDDAIAQGSKTQEEETTPPAYS